MKTWFKKHFAVSEPGAETLQKATIACFLTDLWNMTPVILLMFLADQLLNHRFTPEGSFFPIQKGSFSPLLKGAFSPLLLCLSCILILLVLYVLLSKEYVCLYDATYKESANLRKEIAGNLADLPIAYFSRHDLTDLSESIMSDVERIEHALSHSVPKVVAMVFFFPLMGALLCLSNWKLGLATLLPTVFSFLLVPLSRQFVVNNNQKYYNLMRENAEAFQEHIDLHQEISSFLPEEEVRKELFQKMDQREALHIKTEMSSLITVGISGIFAFLSVATVVFVGYPLFRESKISLLYLLGFLIASMKLKEIFDISKESLMEIFYIAPAVRRIAEIKHTPKQEGEKATLSDYSITFQDVSFSYQNDRPILKDVSVHVNEGELFALVGPSGCGKTTILRLLSRLYDAKTGTILIGDRDLQRTSTDSIFQNISMVFQEVNLFNTTVMENIRLGRADATDEEVREAARLANCFDFIEQLPEGFQTKIGENGAELSGGERQRISIARAFLKDAPILLLDEIAANLDIDNERKIQESISSLIGKGTSSGKKRQKTVLIVSHRMKSITKADRILVLSGGRVEACGSHEELMAQSPTYRNLVEKSRLAEQFTY